MDSPDLQKRLAANVRRLRLAASLSQEELATRCGLHRTYVGAIERGERNVTLQALAKIAVALGVEPTDLLKASPS